MSLARIRKGDTVMLIGGRDRGKSGRVLRVVNDRKRVYVEGLNMVKKHQRPQGNTPGGIVEREASVHLSNVMPLCRECDKAARVGAKRLGDGEVVRICRRCGNQIETASA